MTKKVLIITYYWPPSGGAGVQRWLKLTKYLAKNEVECHVLTVDEKKSSYPIFDYSLLKDIHPAVVVHKTNSFEITNIYKRLVGAKNVPTSGFSNVNTQSWKNKLATRIRSNFFIPDPRIGWNHYAYKQAVKIIQESKIKTVITTSPPHSTQLIGLKLKKNGISENWIADLRDPWTDIYYYPLLLHSKRSHKINLHNERQVLDKADQLIVVSKGLKEGFKQKTTVDLDSKFHIIPNGYDQADFRDVIDVKEQPFTITYTGTMSDIYEPKVVFESIKNVFNDVQRKYIVKIIGSVSSNILAEIDFLGLNCEFISTVPHSEITKFQQEADLLLLFIPNSENAEGILTGKLFEYLAARKPILNLGPKDGDAACIISECKSGSTFDRNEKRGIEDFIKLISEDDGWFKTEEKEIIKYSRENQALSIKNLIA